MCVASPSGVALREDQHVLAQRGQMVPTEWAAVRGGLQVLCGTYGPPARVPRVTQASHSITFVYGKSYLGMERSTFVIDADGRIVRVMRKVKPAEHADDVLAALP